MRMFKLTGLTVSTLFLLEVPLEQLKIKYSFWTLVRKNPKVI